MSLFSNASPEQLRDMRNEAQRAGKLEGFDAAVAAQGLQVAAPPDQDVVRLHKNHGVAFDAKPEQYRFEWRDPSKVTLEGVQAAKAWSAKMGFEPGFASSIVSRAEQLAPEINALSERDRGERQAKAVQMLGGQPAYDAMLAKARDALKAGGDFALLKQDSHVLASDPYLLATLARFGESRTALEAKLAERAAKK
jgi:hypothetical protein